MQLFHRPINLLFVFVIGTLPRLVEAIRNDANFTHLCELQRNASIAQNTSLTNDTRFVCGQTYNPDTSPALDITISLPACLSQCPGYQISDIRQSQQWIGPLVGFILPSLAFVMSIPRLVRMPRGDDLFAESVYIRLPWLFASLALLALDLVFWIVTIFALAGPLMAGALHEVVLDHEVLCAVDEAWRENRKLSFKIEQRYTDDEKAATNPSSTSVAEAEKGIVRSDTDIQNEITRKTNQARAAILFALVGNFIPDLGRAEQKRKELSLPKRIIQDIGDSSHGKEKLETLIALLPSYASVVGVPITFYLGAYAYSLADAGSRRGDNGTYIHLAVSSRLLNMI
jgi:hypothetical protein